MLTRLRKVYETPSTMSRPTSYWKPATTSLMPWPLRPGATSANSPPPDRRGVLMPHGLMASPGPGRGPPARLQRPLRAVRRVLVAHEQALAAEGAVVDVHGDRLVEPPVVDVELRPPLAREVVDRADARRPVVVDRDLLRAVD